MRKTEGTLRSLVALYEQSPAYLDLADSTKKSYARYIRKVEADFGDLPISALSDRRVRGDFLAWRDAIAAGSRRQADHAFVVLARIISWSYDRGLAPSNPCLRPGRLYRVSRSEKVWTDRDEAAFYELAPPHLHLALNLALWTGQRQGDLLRLKWDQYDGKHLRLKQGKRGARVEVPVGESLRLALEAAKAARIQMAGEEVKLDQLTILATLNGTAWTADGFRTSWGRACAKAGVFGVTFHDLRGTAVTRLAIAGCSTAEIATITGHSLKDVEAILDAHYLKRDSAMATSAIRKLENSRKTPN